MCMLPILLYPITVPVIIAGVRGTTALLQSPPDEPTAHDVDRPCCCPSTSCSSPALWTFEPLMTE